MKSLINAIDVEAKTDNTTGGNISMKIARYLAHGQISYGAVEGDLVKELSSSPFENYTITDHTHRFRMFNS